jgi:hypothetical protein
MERCGLLPDTAAARPRAVETGPSTAGAIGQQLPRAAKREQGRSACGGLRVCVRASCCDPRPLCVRPCGHAVKAPPSGREAVGGEGRPRCPTDFGYADLFIQSTLVGLGVVAMIIRIQTSPIRFNPERVKSVWIVDDANPLPGLLPCDDR